MNESSNTNGSSTGGVCSSCLKEMPLIMTSSSSSSSSSSLLCSNCISEFIDPQLPFSSDMNSKFPLFPSSQPLLSMQQQQYQQHQSQSMVQQPHFSPLSSSSASSTSSISSSNRRFSAFDPFTSGNDFKTNIFHPFSDLNHAFQPLNSTNNTHNNNNNNDLDSTATSDFMRYFHHFLNGNNNSNNNNHITDRDSPASSIQSNDFSPLFGSSLPTTNNHLPSHSLLQRQHSAFSSLDSTTSSTPSLNRLSANDLPSSFCCFANNPPYTYCLDCETSLCEKCALTHPKILAFKDHRQQLLSSSSSSSSTPMNNNNHNNPRSIIGQPARTSSDSLPSNAGNESRLLLCLLIKVISLPSSYYSTESIRFLLINSIESSNKYQQQQLIIFK